MTRRKKPDLDPSVETFTTEAVNTEYAGTDWAAVPNGALYTGSAEFPYVPLEPVMPGLSAEEQWRALATFTTAMYPEWVPEPEQQQLSEHVDHAGVFRGEVEIRLAGFRNSLAALQAELDGRRITHDETVAALERERDSSVRSLETRISILQRAERMAVAALYAATGEEDEQ